jgi:hypothetical protein
MWSKIAAGFLYTGGNQDTDENHNGRIPAGFLHTQDTGGNHIGRIPAGFLHTQDTDGNHTGKTPAGSGGNQDTGGNHNGKIPAGFLHTSRNRAGPQDSRRVMPVGISTVPPGSTGFPPECPRNPAGSMFIGCT